VVTDVGANPDLVEDGASGYLVSTRDAGAIADCVLQLARDPKQISIGEIVRIAEKDFSVVECHVAGSEPSCAIFQACNLKRGLRRAMDAFMQELDRMTLADAVTQPSVAAPLLGIEAAPRRAAIRIAPARPAPGRRSARGAA